MKWFDRRNWRQYLFLALVWISAEILVLFVLHPRQSYQEMAYYVECETGHDLGFLNSCQNPHFPCRTVEHAMGQIPETVRHKVSIRVGKGDCHKNWGYALSLKDHMFTENGIIFIQPWYSTSPDELYRKGTE